MSAAYDVAVVGGGAAGLSVLLALDRAGLHGLRVALVDPVHRRGADRTWCFWDAGASPVEAAVHRAWRSVVVVGRDGGERVLDLAPLRYVMVRSAEFYALAEEAAARLGVDRVPAAASAVMDGPAAAVVVAGGERVEAHWVLDSRPAAPLRPGRTLLLQHFRGRTLRLPVAALDPYRPVLMDFSVPQPRHGLAFGYLLPSDACTALVEYTEFSRSRLDSAAYDAALDRYVAARLGEAGRSAAVLGVEDGAIPMTDAVFARRVGRRVVRLGTAGGATRPATGYTFAAIQRQAAAVAAALAGGRVPLPPPAYPARHRWLDAVLLRALDRGLVDGPAFFETLFAAHPAERVLRFLDGATSPREELAVMLHSPRRPMLRATLGDAIDRARQRLSPR